jgi:hypothetical protein
MSKEYPLPMNQVVERLYHNIAYDFNEYRTHAQPLEIQARGSVLIIGPGEFFEELVLIEQDLVDKKVDHIMIIGYKEINSADPVLEQFNKNYHIPIEISWDFYYQLFDAQPQLMFDTIIFLGAPLSDPLNTFNYLSEHLTVGGTAYFTVNVFHLPELITNVSNFQTKLIENLPSHPFYNLIGFYYGAIIERII